MTFYFYISRRIRIKIANEQIIFEDIYNINPIYLEILYKVGEFCAYDMHGDLNTIPDLITNAYGSKEKGSLTNHYRWFQSSLGECEYSIFVSKEENDFFSLHAYFVAFLSDKNLII